MTPSPGNDVSGAADIRASLDAVDRVRAEVVRRFRWPTGPKIVALAVPTAMVLMVPFWHSPTRYALLVAAFALSCWVVAVLARRFGGAYSFVRNRPLAPDSVVTVVGLWVLMMSLLYSRITTSGAVTVVCLVAAPVGTWLVLASHDRRARRIARDATYGERAHSATGSPHPALRDVGTLEVATAVAFFHVAPGATLLITLDMEERDLLGHLDTLSRAGHVRMSGRLTPGLRRFVVRLTKAGRAAYDSHVAALRGVVGP